MKYFRLLPGECLRLLRGRLTLATAALTVLSPILGICFYKPVTTNTMQSIYIANPAIVGGIAGFAMFGILTVIEYDRIAKNRVDRLTDVMVSHVKMASVRFFALLVTALLTFAAAVSIWLPVSRMLVGEAFTLEDYFASYLLFMGTSMIFGIIIAASAYNITCRAELAGVVMICFAALSLTVWKDKWQLCFINPLVDCLSDDFSNHRLFMSVGYMKLTWLAALSGLHILSGLCIRQYGKTLAASFALGARKAYKPFVAVALLGCAVFAYICQPMVDKSNFDLEAMTFYEMPWLEDVFCTHSETRLLPDTVTGNVSGNTVYRFSNNSGEGRLVAFAVTPGYRIGSVKANGKKMPFTVSDYQEFNEAKLELILPPEEEIELEIGYAGFPKEDRNISYMQGHREISKRYLCLENANIAPSLLNVDKDVEVYENVCEVVLPAQMSLISFGEGKDEVIGENPDGTKTWRVTDNGGNTIIYAGDYVKEEVETETGTIDFFYGRKHKTVMDALGVQDVVKAAMDYCTDHYGPLFTLSENGLKLIESRVSHSGYAGFGASTMDEADFTLLNMTDSSKGATGGEVMIHELVHQWWGQGRTFPVEDDGAWSAEGLTVYTSYRIAKELFGEEYARKNYIDLWKDNLETYRKNFYVRNPEYLDRLSEQDRSVITGSLSDLRKYDEMPLKLLKAEELVGGEEAFDRILYELFNSEPDYENPDLSYEEFLDACGLSEEDLELEQNIRI